MPSEATLRVINAKFRPVEEFAAVVDVFFPGVSMRSMTTREAVFGGEQGALKAFADQIGGSDQYQVELHPARS